MDLRKLRRPAFFISIDTTAPRLAWTLPKGTVIGTPVPNAPSPITHDLSEMRVSAPDKIGRIWRGWIARTAHLGAPIHRVMEDWEFKLPTKRTRLGPLDTLRQRILETPPRDGVDKRGQPQRPWTILPWLCKFGRTCSPLLGRVLRELGRKRKFPKQHDDVISLVMKLVTDRDVSVHKIERIRTKINKEEARRAEVAALKAAEKSKRKEIVIMATKTKSTKRARSMSRTVGEQILKIKGVNGTIAAAGKKLAGDGTFTAKQYATLRDAINEASAKAREGKKTSLASALSDVNRLVRRLQRSVK